MDGTKPPSHDELNKIAEKVEPYVEKTSDNYIYIKPDSKHSNNSSISINKGNKSKNTPHSINSSIKTNLINKVNQTKDISSKKKKEEKKNPIMIIIIFICLIIIFIGIIFYYQKYSKENHNDDDQLIKKESNSSNESQISILSNSDKSLKDNNFIFSPLKQIKNIKQRTITNWFKLDDDI